MKGRMKGTVTTEPPNEVPIHETSVTLIFKVSIRTIPQIQMGNCYTHKHSAENEETVWMYLLL